MASLRGATLPERLAPYASSLSGFTRAAIEQACQSFEREPVADFTSRFPELGRMIGACRGFETRKREQSSTAWTVERYRQCYDFDQWFREQVENGVTREAAIESFRKRGFDTVIHAWTAWTNQRAAGVLECAGWCDVCLGDRIVPVAKDGSPWDWRSGTLAYAKPCPACRRAA